MKRLTLFSLALGLAFAPACGDDDGGGGPDARINQPDAMTDPDGMPSPDAGDDPDAGADPDAMGDPDAMPAAGIAAARAAADGSVNVTIDDVFVTYTKEAIGNDVAGFFVQKEMTGPALFIAVDPATLTPVPAVGDDVSFTITEMGTAGMLRQATMISGLTVNSSGNDLSGLVQDVSNAADLVSAVGDYEAELISGTFTVSGAFGFAGSGHLAGTIESAAITGNEDLLLRLPEALQDVYAFEATCTITVSAVPMWRFNTDAQVSVWTADDFTATCPAPTVVSAVAPTATTVDIVFTRGIDAASIVDASTQFTFTGGAGLTASAATVNGTTVTVTTGTQVPGQEYTVTVADTVDDVLGAGVGTPASATFNGFGTPEGTCNDGLDDDVDGFIDCQDTDCALDAQCTWAAQLYIWESDADTTSTDVAEFIEIRNMSATQMTLDGYYLVFVNGSDDLSYQAVALTGTLAAGALYVAGNAGVTGVDATFADGSYQNGPDGVLLVHCPTCTDANDFPNDTDVGTGTTFMANGNTATKIDALAYDTGDADDADLWGKLGVTTQYDEDANGAKDTQSVHRTSVAGWTVADATPDADNDQL